MATATSLRERYERVQRRVADAAARTGRAADDILVVAVTKHAEPEQIRELLHLGHADFGESRVTQLCQRAAMMDEYLLRLKAAPEVARAHDPEVAQVPERARWHLIGRLQRNKCRKAVEQARLIHSVDSLRLAEELHAIGMRRDVTVDMLLQLNCSGEPSKQGVAPPAALHVAEQIDTMVHVRLRGLMTMGPNTQDEAAIRFAFEQCRETFEDIRKTGVGASKFNLLSMGMSGDFELAIEHGANIVRVGSAIFGEGDDHHEEAVEED